MKVFKLLSGCLAASLLISSAPVYADSDGAFFQKIQDYTGEYTDVTPDNPYYKAIVTAYEYGIVDESAFGFFRPDDPLCGGEAVAFAVKLNMLYHGAGAAASLIPSDPFVWYSGYYDYGRSSNIIYVLRKPENPYQRAFFLTNLTKILPESVLAPLDESITTVPGLENSPDLNTVLLFYQSGIFEKEETFQTETPFTRGEVMQVLARIMDPSLRKH